MAETTVTLKLTGAIIDSALFQAWKSWLEWHGDTPYYWCQEDFDKTCFFCGEEEGKEHDEHCFYAAMKSFSGEE